MTSSDTKFSPCPLWELSTGPPSAYQQQTWTTVWNHLWGVNVTLCYLNEKPPVRVRYIWQFSSFDAILSSCKDSMKSLFSEYQREVREGVHTLTCTMLSESSQWAPLQGFEDLSTLSHSEREAVRCRSFRREKVSSSKLVQVGNKREQRGLLMCWVLEGTGVGRESRRRPGALEAGYNRRCEQTRLSCLQEQYAGVSSSGCFWRLPGQLKGLNRPI